MPAAARHPHLAQPRPAGSVRVDFHVHTMWSGDSTTTPGELAEAVAESGVDVLCITDHGTIAGASSLAASGELGCRVIVGQEVATEAGEIIGLFLSERIAPGQRPTEVAQSIRRQGGLVYVPHPFDDVRRALRLDVMEALAVDGLIDVVEVINAKTSGAEASRLGHEFAARTGVARGAGSDSHVPSAVGAAYVEMADFDGPQSFLQATGSGTLHGHHYDAPRPWRARIIPSTKER